MRGAVPVEFRARAWVALCAAALVGCATPGPGPLRKTVGAGGETAPGRPATVVLVSVEGLTPDRYSSALAAMPRLAERARGGVRADRVVPVFPGGRYPAHATLVSGRHPSGHGVTGDALLGERGVRRTPPWHASHVQASSLWQVALAERRRVVALGWPSTAGAATDGLVPGLERRALTDVWLERLRGVATPLLLESLEREVAGAGAWPTAPRRDHAMAALGCDELSSARPAALVLIRFEQTAAAIAESGLDSPAAADAFERVDALIDDLSICSARGGSAASTAFVVVGDRAFAPVHTRIAPNVLLQDAGLIAVDPRSATGIGSWRAIARAGGATANVYASDETAALEARSRLEALARDRGEFRIVPAAEVAILQGDPNAWFALQAAPGYELENRSGGPWVAASRRLAADGVDPRETESAVGLVAFGRGLRGGARVPRFRQIDVAPTLAALLGVGLREADGRPLVGILSLEVSR